MDGDKITSVNILNEIKPTACSGWFFCCKNLTEIKNIDNLNTSACTEMVCMFYNCESLTSLDVSNWNTSKCTDMLAMFVDCSSLTSLDASNWYTSKCENMSYMFQDCSSLTSLDASNWYTSKCTDMSYMFQTSGEFNTLSGHSLHGSCEEKIQYCREHIFDMTNVVNCEEMFGDEFA